MALTRIKRGLICLILSPSIKTVSTVYSLVRRSLGDDLKSQDRLRMRQVFNGSLSKLQISVVIQIPLRVIS